MMKIQYILCFVILFWSCSSESGEENPGLDKRQYTEERNPVDILVLQRTTFKKEMV
ncbi:unnamed protein product, partial [marine sediment metagenome]